MNQEKTISATPKIPDEDSGDEYQGPRPRQELFVCFTNEKDLRNSESIRIKASLYTGIAIRLKHMSESAMTNLLNAIEQDNRNVELQHKEAWKAYLDAKAKSLRKKKMIDKRIGKKKIDQVIEDELKNLIQPPSPTGIVNLRFEEVRFTKAVAAALEAFLKTKRFLKTIGCVKVTFEDPFDFKKIAEGVQLNGMIEKLVCAQMVFDEEFYGKHLQKCLVDSRSLKELDVSNVDFIHPKVFYDLCSSVLSERCRLQILKLRGLRLTKLEGKTLQYVLMKNKMLTTLDLSFCLADDPTTFDFFLAKLNRFCNIRYFTFENVKPDLSNCVEAMATALAENTKLEILILRNNSIKWTPYQNFWVNLCPNRSLQKINVQKTDLNDRVCEKLAEFLKQEHNVVTDLDLSKNLISDSGLVYICRALSNNKKLKFLTFATNNIRFEGLEHLVHLLKVNTTLQELSLGQNRIGNEGIAVLSKFLSRNQTLHFLDISRNLFADPGFEVFAKEMAHNNGLTLLDISKNREVTDDMSLIHLAKSLSTNRSLQTLDLTGLRVRKPFLKLQLEPALRKNIAMKQVIQSKLDPRVIDAELHVNCLISAYIQPHYTTTIEYKRDMFDVRLVEPERYSKLDLTDIVASLIKPAFKMIEYHDIIVVDFTNMKLHDDSIAILAGYVSLNPGLRSVILDRNPFSNDGWLALVDACRKNTNLAHISIKECLNLTDDSLKAISDVICEVNTTLFQIDFDRQQFSMALCVMIKQQTILNRSICEKLKPKRIVSTWPASLSSSAEKTQIQLPSSRKIPKHQISVSFTKDAPVASFFDSVIKSFHIMSPNVIFLAETGITDGHLKTLCIFMAGKNCIHRLNLRRNFISNEGAKHLAYFISEQDDTLTHVDLTRNRISDEGGYALLSAIQNHTRLVEFGLGFGNNIPGKIVRHFDAEIKANNQILRETNSQKKKTKVMHKQIILYELVDKGPDYMRCAVKSTELLKILHLSLPDNLLGLEETRMLAQMIKKNTPLKTLNLQRNQMNALCAILLASALNFNDNLRVLDVSDNKMGDLGVQSLVDPLIRKKLHEMHINASTAPVIEESNMMNLKAKRFPLAVRKGVEIKVGLKIINVKQNRTSQEVLKQIWTLLNLCEDVVILVSKPEEETVKYEAKPYFSQIEEIRRLQESIRNNSIYNPKNGGQELIIAFDEEPSFIACDPDFDGSFTEKARLKTTLRGDASPGSLSRSKSSKREFVKPKVEEGSSLKLAIACLTRYNKSQYSHTGKGLPSVTKICCWRVFQGRETSCKFFSSVKTLEAFEKDGKRTHDTVAIFLVLDVILMYLGFVLVFLYKKEESLPTTCEENHDACNQVSNIVGFAVVAALAFFYLVTELALLLRIRKHLPNQSIFNSYIISKVLAGVLSKVSLLLGGLVSYKMLVTQEIAAVTISWVLLGCLCVGQVIVLMKTTNNLRVDCLHLLPTVERNMKLAHSTGHLGVHLLYQKLSLEPTEQAKSQQADIQKELELEILGLPAPVETEQVKTKALSSIKRRHCSIAAAICQWKSRKFWHVFFVTIPIGVTQFLCFLLKETGLTQFVVVEIVLIVDLIVNLVMMMSTEELNLDHESVYKALERREENLYEGFKTRYGAQADFDAEALNAQEEIQSEDSDSESVELHLRPTESAESHQEIEVIEKAPVKRTLRDMLVEEQLAAQKVQAQKVKLSKKKLSRISVNVDSEDEGIAPSQVSIHEKDVDGFESARSARLPQTREVSPTLPFSKRSFSIEGEADQNQEEKPLSQDQLQTLALITGGWQKTITTSLLEK